MEIWYNYETAIKIRHCDKIWRSAVHIIAHNFFRQFLNVTFNEIFCLLALFLFYGIRAKYIASGNSWWLLWPKCWLETEFDYRLRLRFSLLIQLILSKCGIWNHYEKFKKTIWSAEAAKAFITYYWNMNIPSLTKFHLLPIWYTRYLLVSRNRLDNGDSGLKTRIKYVGNTLDLYSLDFRTTRNICSLW